MIFPAAYVISSVKTGAALTDDDVTGCYQLSAEAFYAQPFCIGVASVTSATASFLMSHNESPILILSRNASNLDFCVVLTVPHLFHMVLTSSEFNDLDFFMSALRHNGRSDLAAFNIGQADFDAVA